MDPEPIRLALVAKFRAAADPAWARGMQAYMKTTVVEHPVTTKEDWLAVAFHLWRKAQRREEWFAAIEWTGIRPARVWQQTEVLPLYEEMITSSAWWDTVDTIAARRVGTLLKNDLKKMKPILRRWAQGDDLWKRRSAILSQLTFKQDTDLDFFFATMTPSLERKEFWLRKAIGWALRTAASAHEKEVLAFVREHRDVLSGLSKREALKHFPDKTRAALS